MFTRTLHHGCSPVLCNNHNIGINVLGQSKLNCIHFFFLHWHLLT